MKREFLRFIGLTFMVLVISQSAFSQTTAFTYQGSLQNSGNPANGNHDFLFALFDTATGGTQLGSAIQINDLAVTNGVFSVSLDFGSQFPGANRFLQILVKQSGGGQYTTLTPRQPVASSPYSIQSLNATNATNAANATNAINAVNAANATNATNATNAANAAQLGGIAPSGFIQNTTVQQPSTNFNISGQGTANIINAATEFKIGGSRILSAPATNTFVGRRTGDADIGGTFNNTFIGFASGESNTSGFFNTFVGSAAGRNSITANSNSFFGYLSGEATTTGGGNSFFGSVSGASNTIGIDNSFFGFGAGRENTSGLKNSFFGGGAGAANQSGDNSAFFGYFAGRESIATGNSFFGSESGAATTSGGNNSFFGMTSGFENTTGSDNAFFGVNTGRGNTLGSRNTLYGRLAGRFNTTGDDNTFVGYNSASSSVTGTNNTAVGANTNVSDGLTFATAIGAGVTVSTSNTIQLGRAADTVNIAGKLKPLTLGSAGSTSLCRNATNEISTCSSSIRYKSSINDFTSGSSLIKRLRPVSFVWTDGGILDIGLVAEDVAAVEPLLTTTNEKGEIEGVKYDRVGVVLVNAVNEQQAQIETLHQQIDGQSEKIRQQQTRLAEQDERLRKQQAEIEALKQLVCSINQAAKLCQAQEENK
jgi:hypothetical protein